jgi:peptidoglycan/xylan/chitin deacetylase (PgdA/CDA1 family)
VVPTKDRPAHVTAAVDRLLVQTRPPQRIVVVDASDPPFEASAGLVDRARNAGVDLVVVSHEPSTSAQRNFGLQFVETPIVLFHEDDLAIDVEYAAALLRPLEQDGSEQLGGAAASPVSPDASALARLRRGIVSRRTRGSSDGTIVSAVNAAAVAFRTPLARRHRFDERFHGYAPGDIADMSARLAEEAPIVRVPDARYRDLEPGGKALPERWYHRGRRGTYFRLQRAARTPRGIAAFGLSLLGEVCGAAADSFRERDPVHMRSYVVGVARTLGEFHSSQLKPSAYYAAGHRYQRARIRIRRRRGAGGGWTGVRVLGYHRVSPDRDLLAVSPELFRRQLELALEWQLVPLSLSEVIDRLDGPIDGRYFAVTFDDGYRDVLENAVPILRELEIPATVFVSTGVVDGVARFSWYRSSPPVMTWEELRELGVAGHLDVQAHSRTHRLLTRLADEEVRNEIVGCKLELESRLPTPVTSFCYPAGLYGRREVELVVEAGFRAGVSCDPGVVRAGVPRGALPRTMISSLDRMSEFEAKLAGVLDERSGLGAWVHRRRSVQEEAPASAQQT